MQRCHPLSAPSSHTTETTLGGDSPANKALSGSDRDNQQAETKAVTQSQLPHGDESSPSSTSSLPNTGG